MPITLAPHQTAIAEQVKATIRDIPDFPKPGILFKDITPVLGDPVLFQATIRYFVDLLQPFNIQYVAGIESRGFILGAPLAAALGAGFVPIRKMGKLPGLVERHEYDLEYGSDCIEIHQDAIPAGANVVLIDDLLATGGTAAAATSLLGKLDANLKAIVFLIELSFLDGRSKLAINAPGAPLYHAMLQY